MKTGKFSILLAVISLAIFAIAACTPSRVSVDEYNQVAATATGSEVEPEPVEEVAPETGEEQEPAPVVEEEELSLIHI